MRILGIDHGQTRTGLALSDDLGMLATPLETVETPNAAARILEIVKTREVGRLVIGLPRNMDGSEGFQAKIVRQFAEGLRNSAGLEIVFWDERLTSRSVERMLIEADVSRRKRREVVDKLAAQQILQSYLDAQGNNV
ncbi:MAG: Holliday junction resolvase RuvX [Verrucomicrobiae bacterium]|nr:Holliday junction resolvase RuvX [Verrucomicrobiae bacterium]